MSQMRKLSLKERRFVKNYIQTGNLTEATIRSYDTKNRKNANAMGPMIIRRPAVKAYLQELLDEQGLSDEKIAGKLKKIIDAGTRRVPLKETTAQTALDALKFTAKLKDIIPSQKIEQKVDQKTATLNLNLTGKSEEELQITLDTLVREINSFRKKFFPKQEPAELKEPPKQVCRDIQVCRDSIEQSELPVIEQNVN